MIRTESRCSTPYKPFRWGSVAQELPYSSVPDETGLRENDLDNADDEDGRELLDSDHTYSIFHTDKKSREVPRRIHVLGIGNVGTFVAHSLAGIPNRPPITLMLRGKTQARTWSERKDSGTLKITTHDLTEARDGFDIEWPQISHDEGNQSVHESFTGDSRQRRGAVQVNTGLTTERDSPVSFSEGQAYRSQRNNFQNGMDDGSTSNYVPIKSQHSAIQREIPQQHLDTYDTSRDGYSVDPDPEDSPTKTPKENESIIYNLVVTLKAHGTAKAINTIAHRLTRESTILFLQNGMGIINEVNNLVFPDPAQRPTYMVGINSHGLKKGRLDFEVIHSGKGTIALGIMPPLLVRESERIPTLSESSASARYMLRTMTRTPVFVAVGFPPTQLLQQQLDKLAVNAIINPLTAILNIVNGGLVANFYLKRVIRLLLAEVAAVIRSLPELQNVPNVKMRFEPARLERIALSVAEKTYQNDSSMLQDVRYGRQTEIDYINGYIVKRGEELGVHCVLNYMLMHMVKAKGVMTSLDREERLPISLFKGPE